MPFIADDQNEEKKQQEQGQQGAPGAPAGGGNATVLGGGQSGSIGGGSTQAAPAAAKPSSSGSFVNLKSYLDTNNSRAGEMGSKVQGHVDAQQTDADTKVTTLRDTAQNDITTNTVTDDKNLTGMYNTAATNPTDSLVATNLATYDDDFGTLWNAQYGGKTGLSEFDGSAEAQAAVGKVAQSGQLAKDFAGQQTLMKDTYANNGRQYDRGGGMLDTYLVAGGTDTFGNVAAQGDAYKDTYTDLQNWFNTERQAGVDTTDKTREDFQGAVTSYGTGLDSALSDAETKAADATGTLNATVESARAGDPKALAAMGFDDVTIKYLMANPDARDAYISDATGVGAGSQIDQSLLGRYADLMKLTGGDADYLASMTNKGDVGAGGKFSDTGEGSYNTNAAGAKDAAVEYHTNQARERINSGTIKPASLIAAGGPQAPGMVALAQQYGVDMSDFIVPDPSSSVGWRLDVNRLSPVINAAIEGSGAGSAFADSSAYRSPSQAELDALHKNDPMYAKDGSGGRINPNTSRDPAADAAMSALPTLGQYLEEEPSAPAGSGGEMSDEEKEQFFS